MTAARRSVVYSENIGAISSSEPAAGAAPALFWSCQLMDDVELDLCRAWVGHAQFFGRRDRDIDDAARHKRTAIVDSHDHGTAVGDICYAQLRPEWQAWMRGGHCVRIEGFAIRGKRPLVVIETGNTA